MPSSPNSLHPAWLRFAFLATSVVAVVFLIDLSVDIDGTTRGLLRGVVVAAAAAVAGIFFQRWSTLAQRSVPDHAMAGLALLGGALIASSAFSAGAGVFGNTVTASLGTAALWISLLAGRASLASPTGDRR